MIDLDKLERLAKAATPGKWESATVEETPEWFNIVSPSEGWADIADVLDEQDAEFIAAANPQTVQNLVNEMRRLERIVIRVYDDPEATVTRDELPARCRTREALR